MAPKDSRVGGLLSGYLSVCVLVGSVWVAAIRHRANETQRPDLEALAGGMIIFGAILATWFAAEQPLIEFGVVGDGIEGFSCGMILGFVVTGLLLVARVFTDTSSRA